MTASNETRHKLLGAAMELIAQDGIQTVTHRSVEVRAGVARGSMRYYFHTREELLAELLGHMAELDAAVMAQAEQATPGASLEPGVMSQDIQAQAMATMAAGFLADPAAERARFELLLYASQRPELAEVVARWRAGFVELSAAHLRAQGAPHPEAAARMVIAAMDGLILHALTEPHSDYQAYGPAWMSLLAQVAVGFTPGSGAPSAG